MSFARGHLEGGFLQKPSGNGPASQVVGGATTMQPDAFLLLTCVPVWTFVARVWIAIGKQKRCSYLRLRP